MDQRVERLLIASADAQRAGQLDVAERLALDALKIDPECVNAQFLLGVLYARKGNGEAASLYLGQVLDRNPQAYEALISLSTLYMEGGRTEEAIALGIRAVQVKPGDAQAYNHLGRCFLAARQLEEAASAFVRAVQFQPGFSAAFYNLGKAKQLDGKDGEAAQAFEQALRISPTLKNFLAFGQILITLVDFEGVAACAAQCVKAFPDSAAAHLLFCGALTELNQVAEAENELQIAIDLDGDRQEALEIATRQRALGHVEAANKNLRRAIAQNPRSVWAYDGLMHNQRVTEEDRGLVDNMLGMLQEGKLAPTELVSIHYGLGKALEDLRDYEASMLHYNEANRITRQLKLGDVRFDEENYSRHIDQVFELYVRGRDVTPELVSDSSLPVLIVGMMRSGTTLAEQILSSHSKVAPAGEQLFWSRNWRRALEDLKEISVLGREYVELLSQFGSHPERVTDKMPGNYLFAGVIHLALPNAKIIHMRRTPVDNCLSIWATPNCMPHEGGHNKENIAYVYRQYLRLMEQWRAVLPADRFLEVDYEELVADNENMARRMVEFCGLEWEDSCLRPEDNKRTVLTPSAWQVRQPVYKTSVERWRRYEPYLGEFSDLVGVQHPQK